MPHRVRDARADVVAALRRPDRAHEAGDAALEAVLSLANDWAADCTLRRGRTCASSAAPRWYVDDAGLDLGGALGGRAADVAGDLPRGRALLLDRREAIAAEISEILPIVAPISLMAARTESRVADWMSAICWLISSVAFAVCSAEASSPPTATTAKPLPASPARRARPRWSR